MGVYESLVVGEERFQVKTHRCEPRAALSLASHHHRSEHWIVVEGTAKVYRGQTVETDQREPVVYIPSVVHRMENPGKLPMVLIEVRRHGSYFGEDDNIPLRRCICTLISGCLKGVWASCKNTPLCRDAFNLVVVDQLRDRTLSRGGALARPLVIKPAQALALIRSPGDETR